MQLQIRARRAAVAAGGEVQLLQLLASVAAVIGDNSAPPDLVRTSPYGVAVIATVLFATHDELPVAHHTHFGVQKAADYRCGGAGRDELRNLGRLLVFPPLQVAAWIELDHAARRHGLHRHARLRFRPRLAVHLQRHHVDQHTVCLYSTLANVGISR